MLIEATNIIMKFFDYLFNPELTDFTKPKISEFLSLFLIYSLGAVFMGLFAGLLVKITNISHIISQMPSKKLILLSFLAPFYEEIIFRSLLRFNKKNLYLFIPTISALIAYSLYRSNIIFVIIFSILLSLVLFALIFSGILSIQKYISKKYKYFFYLSAILFGLMHLTNFKGQISVLIIFSPFLVSPQLFMGAILAYIRTKNGLIYSMLFHLAINITPLILSGKIFKL